MVALLTAPRIGRTRSSASAHFTADFPQTELRGPFRLALPGTPPERSPSTDPVRRENAWCVRLPHADRARPGSRTTRRRHATAAHLNPMHCIDQCVRFRCLDCASSLLHQGVKSARRRLIFKLEANQYRDHPNRLSAPTARLAGGREYGGPRSFLRRPASGHPDRVRLSGLLWVTVG